MIPSGHPGSYIPPYSLEISPIFDFSSSSTFSGYKGFIEHVILTFLSLSFSFVHDTSAQSADDLPIYRFIEPFPFFF